MGSSLPPPSFLLPQVWNSPLRSLSFHRLLVATGIAEEGIDVPECDAVVSFDAAITSRERQQRGGRARAASRAYIDLFPRDDSLHEREARQSRLNMWNTLVDRELNGGEGQPPPQQQQLYQHHHIHITADEAEARDANDVLVTRREGRRHGLLPIVRAKATLHEVYLTSFERSGSFAEFDLTGDGTHFSTKAGAKGGVRYGNNFVLSGDVHRGFRW